MDIGDTTSSEQADVGGDETLRDCAGALQPIVRVGVTGHRDPVDPISASRLVTQAFVHVLNVLEAALRHRRLPALNPAGVAPLAFQVVSPLAEGADRIVAALTTSDDATLSARPRELAVPLPFGLASYRGSEGNPGTDCTDESSQHEFDEIGRAHV